MSHCCCNCCCCCFRWQNRITTPSWSISSSFSCHIAQWILYFLLKFTLERRNLTLTVDTEEWGRDQLSKKTTTTTNAISTSTLMSKREILCSIVVVVVVVVAAAVAVVMVTTRREI